jgi:hypothetical protein
MFNHEPQEGRVERHDTLGKHPADERLRKVTGQVVEHQKQPQRRQLFGQA